MTPAGWELSATEAVAAVATGARPASDITGSAIDRVRSLDGRVGAFRVLDEEGALQRAKELDEGLAGPLAGVTVGVKDVIDTADLPTGYGSNLFAHHRPAQDAAVVGRLRTAGAVIVGKTESTEFAMFHPARTQNPSAPGRTPGGSSSGSAAAVASGMVAAALGTQTAGSVVRPAAYCGVYGFKPARGWTDTTGIWLLAEHLDTVGLFARRAADLALLHRALAMSPAAPGWPLRSRPVTHATAAVLPAGEWSEASVDASDALGAVADRAGSAGWQVRAMAMPPSWRHLPGFHATVMAVEVAKNLRARLGARVSLTSESVQAIVEEGERCPALDYLRALEAVDDAHAALRALAQAVDLVLCPSAPGVAPPGLGSTGDPVMCRPATLLGVPAANLPFHRTSGGFPVGVQAIGTSMDDGRFLTSVAELESAFDDADIAPIATGFDDLPSASDQRS